MRQLKAMLRKPDEEEPVDVDTDCIAFSCCWVLDMAHIFVHWYELSASGLITDRNNNNQYKAVLEPRHSLQNHGRFSLQNYIASHRMVVMTCYTPAIELVSPRLSSFIKSLR